MGFGGGTNVTTQEIDPDIKSRNLDLYGQTQQYLQQTPWQQYPGQQVAGFQPMQIAGMGLLADAIFGPGAYSQYGLGYQAPTMYNFNQPYQPDFATQYPRFPGWNPDNSYVGSTGSPYDGGGDPGDPNQQYQDLDGDGIPDGYGTGGSPWNPGGDNPDDQANWDPMRAVAAPDLFAQPTTTSADLPTTTSALAPQDAYNAELAAQYKPDYSLDYSGLPDGVTMSVNPVYGTANLSYPGHTQVLSNQAQIDAYLAANYPDATASVNQLNPDANLSYYQQELAKRAASTSPTTDTQSLISPPVTPIGDEKPTTQTDVTFVGGAEPLDPSGGGGAFPYDPTVFPDPPTTGGGGSLPPTDPVPDPSYPPPPTDPTGGTGGGTTGGGLPYDPGIFGYPGGLPTTGVDGSLVPGGAVTASPYGGGAGMTGMPQFDPSQAFGLSQMGQAAGMAGMQAGMTPDMAQFYNPFISNVLDNTMSDLDRARQMTQTGNASSATMSGAFGGDRHTLLEAETNRNFMDQVGRTSAQLRSHGFDTAAQLAQQNAMRQLSATGLLGQLGSGMQRGVLDYGGALMGLGGQQQALAQAQIQGNMNDFYQARDYPIRGIQLQQGVLQGMPVGMSYSQPAGSPWSGLLGGAMTLGGAALGSPWLGGLL